MTEPAIVILAALILDWLFGDPRWLPHPIIWIGRLITKLEKFWRRHISCELTAGVLLLISTVAITVISATVLLWAARLLHPVAGTLAAIWLAWNCLAARSLHAESRKVAYALENTDPDDARKQLAYIVARDTAELDEPEIWRATVETVAENSSDGVIAPLFYLMLGGPIAAIAYKAVNTLDSMVGYKNDRYLLFGRASARFDDLLNYLPARLTGWLMVLAAPLAGGSMQGAARTMLCDGRNHSSPNAGIPEAATAGAFGVQLGGSSRYFGKTVVKPVIGKPHQPLSKAVYQRSIRLMYSIQLLLTAIWLVCFYILALKR